MITVVVPVHNSAKTLRRVIPPIQEELYPDDLLLAVNDRSTDDSLKILADMGVRTVESRGMPGAAGTRNTGGKQASTDWILFIDSDAVVPRGWRDKLEARIDEAQAVQGVYSRNSPGRNPATFYKNYYYFHTFTRRIRSPFIKGCGTFFFAIERGVFHALGGFDEKISGATIEDADLSERLWARGGRIVIAPEIEVFHLREYTVREFFRYEWVMMRAKALYIMRRDPSRGAPSISVAGFREMFAVLAGAVFSWVFIVGLILAALGVSAGFPVALAGLAVTLAVQAPFMYHAVKDGDSRGALACLLVIPDLLLVLPACLNALFLYLAGRRY